jgi:hypothetical protein
MIYSSSHPDLGFTGKLVEIAQSMDEQTAGSILGTQGGREGGYSFAYTPGEKVNGAIRSYTITARLFEIAMPKLRQLATALLAHQSEAASAAAASAWNLQPCPMSERKFGCPDAWRPSSIGRFTPLIKRASSLARNAITQATSSGEALFSRSTVASVDVRLGATALMRTPR